MSNCDGGETGDLLRSVLRWSGERDYRGHSKHDALNSPLLRTLTFGIGPLQLLATQAVMRSPFNVRSLLGVPKLRNPKGIGLFAHAFLDLAECLGTGGEEADGPDRDALTEEAAGLLAWLISHASPQAGPSALLLEQYPEAGAAEGGTAPASTAA
jgi:hypothetical protein